MEFQEITNSRVPDEGLVGLKDAWKSNCFRSVEEESLHNHKKIKGGGGCWANYVGYMSFWIVVISFLILYTKEMWW